MNEIFTQKLLNKWQEENIILKIYDNLLIRPLDCIEADNEGGSDTYKIIFKEQNNTAFI